MIRVVRVLNLCVFVWQQKYSSSGKNVLIYVVFCVVSIARKLQLIAIDLHVWIAICCWNGYLDTVTLYVHVLPTYPFLPVYTEHVAVWSNGQLVCQGTKHVWLERKKASYCYSLMTAKCYWNTAWEILQWCSNLLLPTCINVGSFALSWHWSVVPKMEF